METVMMQVKRNAVASRGTTSLGNEARIGDALGAQVSQVLRPLTPLLAAAAFAVTAMTLVGSLLVG